MSKSKEEVILEAQRDKKKVHFATWMDICHLKHVELEPKIQKYKGRVVLLCDTEKDEVFTEQGSSASQMTAAKVMDVIARPDCDGQADAVAAYTQEKLEDAPRLLNICKSQCPDIWIRLPQHKWPKFWANIGSSFSSTKFLLSPTWKDSSRKFCWNWECLFVHRKQGLYLSVHVDDIKMAGEKQNMSHLEEIADVDLDEPTSFVDNVYLGCTQRECKPNEIIFNEYREMFESRTSSGATEKLPRWEKPHTKTVAWSHYTEGHAQKCVGRDCELAHRKWSNYIKFQVLAWMIINSTRKNLNQSETNHKFAHKLS